MTHLFGFGYALESARLDTVALGLPGGRILSIASGGEAPLGLLAAGAREVVAVDVAEPQLHLVRLKLAAVVGLERPDAVRFLGYLPWPAGRRRAAYRSLRDALEESTRHFWDRHTGAVERGAIHAGRLGSYVERIERAVRFLLGTGPGIEALLECRTLEEQEEACRRHYDRPAIRTAFRVAFHPRLLGRFGLDPRSLRGKARSDSFGDHCWAVVRRALTATPFHENHVMQLLLKRRVIHEDAVPYFLRREAFGTLRESAPSLRTELTDVRSFLDGNHPPGPFDGFHLSNVADWLEPGPWRALLRALVGCAAPDARLVWRQMHHRHPLPADLACRIEVDEVLGARLSDRELLPIWDICPARIRPEATDGG